jgi:hypothetical protein
MRSSIVGHTMTATRIVMVIIWLTVIGIAGSYAWRVIAG